MRVCQLACTKKYCPNTPSFRILWFYHLSAQTLCSACSGLPGHGPTGYASAARWEEAAGHLRHHFLLENLLGFPGAS